MKDRDGCPCKLLYRVQLVVSLHMGSGGQEIVLG